MLNLTTRLLELETADLLSLLIFGVKVIERGNFASVEYAHPVVAIIVDHSDEAMHLSFIKLPLEQGSKFTYVASNSVWFVVKNCPLVNALNFVYLDAYLVYPFQVRVVLRNSQDARIYSN